MRLSNRLWRYGVSPLALLMMGVVPAFSTPPSTALQFDTTTGTLTNAASGTTYSNGTLLIKGDQFGGNGEAGATIQGDGTAVPHLTILINDPGVSMPPVNVTSGFYGTGGVPHPAGMNIDLTSGDASLEIRSNGGIYSNPGVGLQLNHSRITALNLIGGISSATSSAVMSSGYVGTMTIRSTIQNNSSTDPTIDFAPGAELGTLINNVMISNGSLSNQLATGTAISLWNVTSSSVITNMQIINGDIQLGVASSGNQQVNLAQGSVVLGSILARQSGSGNVSVGLYNPDMPGDYTGVDGSLGTSSAYLNNVTLTQGGQLHFQGSGQIATSTFTVDHGGTLLLQDQMLHLSYSGATSNPVSITGQLVLDTTIDANAGRHGYLVMDRLSGSGGSALPGGADIAIVPHASGSIALGNTYVVAQARNGMTIDSLPSVVNSGGYSWSVGKVVGSGQIDTDGISYGTGDTNIVLTASQPNAAGSVAYRSGYRGALTALVAYDGADSGLRDLSQAINNLPSDQMVRNAGAQMSPEATANLAQASLGAVNQALKTVAARDENVRLASRDSGVSSGESLKGLGVWGQSFGSTASQDRRQDVDGYDADTYGLAFGADMRVMDPLRVGLSLAYARTNQDATGARQGSGQKINSYIATLYGSYAGKGWYLDGGLSYARHDYDSTRQVSLSGLPSQTLKGSFDGQQYGVNVEAGVPLALGKAVVTPLASLSYSNLNQDSYSETGGSAALNVGSASFDSVRSGLGAKASAKVGLLGNWEVIPNARMVWLHEFNDSAPDQTSQFAAGGSSFTTPGNTVAGDHLDVGVGLDLASVRNTTVSVKYDADIADRYLSHSALFQARTEF